LYKKSKYTFYATKLFPENCSVCEKMSKNMVDPEGPQMTIWWRVACWTSKVTRTQEHNRAYAHTHTHKHARKHTHLLTHARSHTQKCVIVIAFPRQHWFRERASVLHYTCIASLLLLKVAMLYKTVIRHLRPYHINLYIGVKHFNRFRMYVMSQKFYLSRSWSEEITRVYSPKPLNFFFYLKLVFLGLNLWSSSAFDC
jgi:hypothetical protein